jgi:hypothetical protein
MLHFAAAVTTLRKRVDELMQVEALSGHSSRLCVATFRNILPSRRSRTLASSTMTSDPLTCHRPGDLLTVSALDPRADHGEYGQELAGLLDAVLAGRLVDDWAAVERRVVVAVGALLELLKLHQVDQRGRCSTCRAVPRAWWWPWPQRVPCTVYSALGFHPRQPGRFALPTLTGRVATAGDRA